MAAPEGYNALGKIGISYKGEYASNTAYERLDAVYHNGSTYLAIKDAPDGAPRDDKINWIYLAKGFSGDIGDTAITFTEAETRENIDTGESVKTVFGRVKKWFADMTAAAFAQIITSNTDLMATTVAGYLPDALAVKNQFDAVNSKLDDCMGLAIVGTGTFQINLALGVTVITQDKLLAGNMPPTTLSLFCVISQSDTSSRFIELFYDNGALCANTNVAQKYLIRWYSFATR